ncbi:MAG: isoleucine--tRNA ligase [Actinomycetota bacterium]
MTDHDAFSPVPPKPDHVALEHEILELWEAEGTFERLRDRNRGNQPWSFVDGPITANNSMGVHHAWGRSLKDIFQRFYAANGHDQRYQNGFDCQGLWVEVEVEKTLGLNSKPEIEEYGLDRFARACRDRVAEYSGVMTRQSKRLGQWMEWDSSYFTMTDTNISYIWTFLKECHDRGWLYVGHRSMPWCPRCGTSLSQHELIDSYADLTHPSIFVRFPLTDADGEYLVAWTTTPWTLPANTAAAVHPDQTYVRVQTADGIAIVAEARLEDSPIEGDILERLPGSALVGRTYTGPFGYLPVQADVTPRVVAWDEVSIEDGTGIVHIAPGCGAEDFELSKIEGLPALVPIDESGCFVEGHDRFTGLATSVARQQLIDDLESRGVLQQAGEITHRYPVCWRCSTELVYRLVDEWFIRCDEVRQPMIEAARTVSWNPPQYGKRMEDWLRNMGDWCISRKRYWGLPLPFWFCPDGHMTLIGSKAELLERATEGAEGLEELHRPWIDAVKIDCGTCGEPATRTTDVGDCWLDAGIVPFSTMGWRNDTAIEGGYAEGAGEGLTNADLPDHTYWERWFPADFISEMREQIRLWFYSLLFMSVVLDGRAPYRNVLTYERVHDETGRPMHKSWGNAIWFDDAVETMGADVMRWMYSSQNPAANLNFGYGPANETKRRLLTLWNVYKFFVDYATINGWSPANASLEGPDTDALTDLDRWMIARTQELVVEANEAYRAYDTPRLIRQAASFIEDSSNWYLRTSRSRFWKNDDRADTDAATETLWYALVTFCRVIAPIMPFLADHIWRNLVSGTGNEPSVHLSGWPKMQEPDRTLLADMDAVRHVVELGRSARAEAKIKNRQPLAKMTVATDDPTARAAIERHAALIASELSVKRVEVTDSSEGFATSVVVPNFRVLGPKLGPSLPKVTDAVKRGDYTFDGETVLVGDVRLSPDEYELRTTAKEGLAVTADEGFACALDTEMTDELAREGRMRDLVRQIQDLRKQHDLELTDRISLTVPEQAGDLVDAFGDHIAAETLSTQIAVGDSLAIERQP